MKGRLLAAVLVALVWCAPALAAPATVQLRVEGATTTIFEGPVTTDGKTIDKGGGPHPCDGTSSDPPQTPGPTMTAALDDASIAAGFPWEGTWFDFGAAGDYFATKIGPDAGAGSNFWGTVLNYVPTSVGGCQQKVQQGDDALFVYGTGGEPLLRLGGPGKVARGSAATVTVTNGGTGAPFSGASIAGAQTGPDGTAAITFDSSGLARLKAEAPGTIRSNALQVCVSEDGTGDCGVPPEQLGTPSASGRGGARDSKAPLARISGLRDGARYSRGPRLLRGTASDDGSGVSVVKLALRRQVKGESCRWWSGRRERFVGTHCRKVFFFAIGSDANWSYQLPRRLGPGRYTLDVKAFDRVRNRDEKFVRGRNRVVFTVTGSGGRAAMARSRPGARVTVMVVGRDGGVLAKARTVRAVSARVRASGRRCLVAASTPLAALARSLASAGIGYRVRDFGRCSRGSGRDSAQLFVDRVAGDRNRGQDGWVYKVDGRAGTAGAGDPTGPFGAGRLRSTDRLLWFYCLHGDGAGSCQRSLVLEPSALDGRAGEALSIKVLSQDNDGRAKPAGGATVTLGPATATADAAGVARLVLPAAGRHRLLATLSGTVPAFPVAITVR